MGISPWGFESLYSYMSQRKYNKEELKEKNLLVSNGCVGSSPTGGTIVPIAQLVLEHKIFNLGVLGSNPNGNTKYSHSSIG